MLNVHLVQDFCKTLSNPYKWIFATWIVFLLKYRKTIMGPFWIICGPMVFIVLLGILYGDVMGYSLERYVPHLGIGLIIWSYISGIVMSAPRLFIQNKPILMQGLSSLVEITQKTIFLNCIIFLHQFLIVILIVLYFNIQISFKSLLIIPALFLILLHSFWVIMFLGILGARFRDIGEIVEVIMRIAFLVTPVIWIIDGDTSRSSTIGVYLLLNPFYHVLEPLRSAVLGTDVMLSSWIISLLIALFGTLLAAFSYQKYRDLVIFWI